MNELRFFTDFSLISLFQSALHSLTAAPQGRNHCSYFEDTLLALPGLQLCYISALPDPRCELFHSP